MSENRLMLDYILDHEEKLRDRVYLTQPVGSGQVVDYTWGQVRRPVAPHGGAPAEPRLPARRAHRDPVEELRALHHGRAGDLDGRLHDGGDLPDRDRRDRALRADAQRGEPAVRRQARHLAAAAARRAGRGCRASRFRSRRRPTFDTWDAIVARTAAARRPPVARCRRTGDADLHLGLDRHSPRA